MNATSYRASIPVGVLTGFACKAARESKAPKQVSGHSHASLEIIVAGVEEASQSCAPQVIQWAYEKLKRVGEKWYRRAACLRLLVLYTAGAGCTTQRPIESKEKWYHNIK